MSLSPRFQRASELDPLSPGITTDVGVPLVFQAKYDAAKEQGRKALELDPGFNFAQWGIGWTDLQAGNFKEAIPELEKARVMNFLRPSSPAFLVTHMRSQATAPRPTPSSLS